MVPSGSLHKHIGKGDSKLEVAGTQIDFSRDEAIPKRNHVELLCNCFRKGRWLIGRLPRSGALSREGRKGAERRGSQVRATGGKGGGAIQPANCLM